MRHGTVLQAYLLGMLDLETTLALQGLIHRGARDEGQAAVVVCEHAPMLTVGRAGSHRHWSFDDRAPGAPAIPVRWLNRGGGCWLHAPGQLAIYVIAPLHALGLNLPGYLNALGKGLAAACQQLALEQVIQFRANAVWAGDRPLACLGVAVADWTTYFGAILNVHPVLDPFRHVRSGPDHPVMTSLQRASRRPLRLAQVREVVVERLAEALGCAGLHAFTDHPFLRRKVRRAPVVAAR